MPDVLASKDFLLKGGKVQLAISKQRKQQVIEEYGQWLQRSQAMILTEYTGMPMKDLDALRAKVREAGGEFHIVKNTLGRKAFESAGYSIPAGFLEGSTAVVFAFQDPPNVAKAVTEFLRTSEFLKVKGGFLGTSTFDAAGVKSLADMPPLPVMRAQLLGTIMAPASKLARTLAEPGRSIAAVIKAYAEPETATAAA